MECFDVRILVRKLEEKLDILFVVNELDFFLSHRLPIARELVNQGKKVGVFSGFDKNTNSNLDRNMFNLSDLYIYEIPLERGKSGVIQNLYFLFKLGFFLIKNKPELIHLITLKIIFLGGILSRILRLKNVVFAFSGLGFTFINERNFISDYLFRRILRFSIDGKKRFFIFQNHDDMTEIRDIHEFSLTNSIIIPGSGVDIGSIDFKKEKKTKNISVVMASRLLFDKGVKEFFDAAKIVNKIDKTIEFKIFGSIDKPNPNSLTEDDLEQFSKRYPVKIMGYSRNIFSVYKNANIIVLPSYREGFPKSLIEAAAVGRAIITTDVPGCREAVIHQKTGILVPSKDPRALAKEILYLANNDYVRGRYAEGARELALTKFNINSVINSHMKIYSKLSNNFVGLKAKR